jgi:hypothetical protein
MHFGIISTVDVVKPEVEDPVTPTPSDPRFVEGFEARWLQSSNIHGFIGFRFLERE